MPRTPTNRLWILAMLVSLGLASNASALIVTGGPVYNLPGGGSCTVAGVASQTGGATVSCTGVSVAAHTHVYFGIRNDTNVNGNTMTGTAPAAGSPSVFDYASSTASSITYASTTTVADQLHGTQPVTNALVLTLTAGSATVVATGGFPASNSFGDIERVFHVTSGSFSVRVDVQASDAFFGPGQASSAVYDPTHTPASGSSDVSKVDLAFYYSDCGDGQVDSPEQCDIGAGNGAPGSCCASNCTFRPSGTVCRAGVDLLCDTSETCTGSAAACPPDDAPINGGNVCRMGSGDVCDQNELCTGVPGQTCPPDDAPGKAGLLCRSSAAGDVCDEPEHCSGTPGGTCPPDDAPGKINMVCRIGSGDVCDPEERCTGVPNQGCPADVVANPTTVCRTGSGDSCDPDEHCTAIPQAPCPADVVTPAGTECRAANGQCDVAEQCSGTAGAACPADALAPANTPCDADSDMCTVDACDGSGMCVQQSPTTCGDHVVQGSCGEQCDDGNQDDGDGCSATCLIETSLACGPAPLTGCRQPIVPGKASLLIKRGSTVPKDQLKWRWLGGEATTLAEYGDPLGATQYQLCVYDDTGLRLHANVPAGELCVGKPCWKAVGSSGFRYGDKELTPDGVRKMNLKAGGNTKAQIKLDARGANLGLPDLSTLAQPVTVQLKNSNGSCWEAIYSAPPRYQSSTIFNDKAD